MHTLTNVKFSVKKGYAVHSVKMFVFRVILVRIFPHSDLYPVRMRENAAQNNSKHGHFSRSDTLRYCWESLSSTEWTIKHSFSLVTLVCFLELVI